MSTPYCIWLMKRTNHVQTQIPLSYHSKGYQFCCSYDNPKERREHAHGAIQITVLLSHDPIYGRCHSVSGKKQVFSLHSQEICVFPPLQRHALECHQASELIFFYLEPGFFRQTIGEFIDIDQTEIVSQYAIQDSLIRDVCVRLKSEIQNISQVGRLYLDSCANLLAVHLVKTYSNKVITLPESQDGLPPNKLRLILDYMHSHLEDEICLSDLANQVNLSRYYFSRLFKQATGLSPYQYLIQERIKLAQRLLKQQNLSIADVAYRCGFSSQSHLTKHFKQWTGITPKRYRCQ